MPTVNSTVVLFNNTVLAGNSGVVAMQDGPNYGCYDPDRKEVFASQFAPGQISVLSTGSATSVAVTTAFGGPATDVEQIACAPAFGELLEAAYTSNSLTIANETTGAAVTSIGVGSGPQAVVYDTLRGEAFVACYGSSTVSVINLTTNSIPATITVGSGPSGEAYDPATNQVFVMNRAGSSISVIDDLTNTVVANLTAGIPSDPTEGVWDSVTGDVWVGDEVGSVFPIHPSTNPSSITVGAPVSIPGVPGDTMNVYGLAYDPASREIFASGSTYYTAFLSVDSSVTEISDQTNSVVGVNWLGNVGTRGDVYVPTLGTVLTMNEENENATEINGTSNRVVDNVLVGAQPYGLAFDGGQDLVVASNYVGSLALGSSSTLFVSARTDRLLAAPTTGVDPLAVAYAAREGEIWVTALYSGNATSSVTKVFILNDTTYQVVRTQYSGTDPYGIAYDPMTNDMWVSANAGGDNISVVNASTFHSVASITLTKNTPYALAYDPAQREMWVTYTSSTSPEAVAYNDTTFATVATVPVPKEPYAIAYAPDVGNVYVASYSGGNLTVINATTGAIVGYVPVGTDPLGLASAPSAEEVFVSSYALGTVSVVNDRANQVVATAYVGEDPRGVVYDPTQNSIYVADYGQGTYSVLNLPTAPVRYAVALTESGLANGSSWSVSNGGLTYSSTSRTIVVPEPNGTYLFSIGAQSGYASPANVTITVAGASVLRSVPFAAAYSITFRETGLAFGTTWGISIGGNATLSVSANLTVSEPNGTYSYRVLPVPGYVTPSWAGSITVSGPGAPVTIPFVASEYGVTVQESGLRTIGRNWSVTVGGDFANSSTAVNAFLFANGTYSYVVAQIPGYTLTNGTGSVRVQGSPVLVSVLFTPIPSTYNVTFRESGLPAGTLWHLSARGTTYPSTGAELNLTGVANGSYAWSVASPGYTPTPGSGTVVVAGPVAPVEVSFRLTLYSVGFNESGLPAGSSWSVEFNGTTQSSETSGIEFRAANDSVGYDYAILPQAGYSTTWAGRVVVDGASVAVAVAFVAFAWPVTFNETGLPGGTTWSVTLAGLTSHASTPSISFEEPNGSYSYVVSGVSRYNVTPASGQLKVEGIPSGVAVTFTFTGAVTYGATFGETGYPAAYGWYLNLSGSPGGFAKSVLVESASVTVQLANGSYSYTVAPLNPGWAATTSGGTFEIVGTAVRESVGFEAVYPVRVTESGLPNGSRWFVNVSSGIGGADRPSAAFASYNGTTPTIAFTLSNGSWSYTVSSIDRTWSPVTIGGTIEVSGRAPAPVESAFQQLYTVEFSETGLAAGTSWTVTVNESRLEGSGSTLSLLLMNGSFSFVVGSVPGYSVTPTEGVVRVAGGSTVVAVRFSAASSQGAGASGWTALDLAWITVGASVAAGIVGVVVWRRRASARAPREPPGGVPAAEARSAQGSSPGPSNDPTGSGDPNPEEEFDYGS